MPLGIGSVFKEAHTFQPCGEGKVEVVDHIPRLFTTHARTHTHKTGEKIEEQCFCDLSEPG